MRHVHKAVFVIWFLLVEERSLSCSMLLWANIKHNVNHVMLWPMLCWAMWCLGLLKQEPPRPSPISSVMPPLGAIHYTRFFLCIFSSQTCLKKPVFSKGDLLQWKVGTSQPVTISKKWKNPSSALRRKRTCTQTLLLLYIKIFTPWGASFLHSEFFLSDFYVDWIFRGRKYFTLSKQERTDSGSQLDFQKTFFFVHLEACVW